MAYTCEKNRNDAGSAPDRDGCRRKIIRGQSAEAEDLPYVNLAQRRNESVSLKDQMAANVLRALPKKPRESQFTFQNQLP